MIYLKHYCYIFALKSVKIVIKSCNVVVRLAILSCKISLASIRLPNKTIQNNAKSSINILPTYIHATLFFNKVQHFQKILWSFFDFYGLFLFINSFYNFDLFFHLECFSLQINMYFITMKNKSDLNDGIFSWRKKNIQIHPITFY